MVLKATVNEQAYNLAICHDKFRGPRTDPVGHVSLETTTTVGRFYRIQYFKQNTFNNFSGDVDESNLRTLVPLKNYRVERLIYTQSVDSKSPLIGVVGYLGGVSSDVFLVT
ncbi:hypothetical protein TNCV_2121 [Trichonephila clavipes]|nr:hypothetical protein TNCV_2121 [Trichonephila clavipes]